MKKIGLHGLLLISLILHTTMGLAHTPPESSTRQPTDDAIEFAQQAGAIAGIAQACGQDITLLNQRVTEVIQTLAQMETEQKLALNVYHKIAQVAQHTQQKQYVVECRNALMELRKLPILQHDYKTNVLAKLK